MKVSAHCPQARTTSSRACSTCLHAPGTTMNLLRGQCRHVWFSPTYSCADDRRAHMAFPRLNAFSFWLTVRVLRFTFCFQRFGAMWAVLGRQRPDVGLCAYAPPPSARFSRGHSTDYWRFFLSLLLSGF